MVWKNIAPKKPTPIVIKKSTINNRFNCWENPFLLHKKIAKYNAKYIPIIKKISYNGIPNIFTL